MVIYLASSSSLSVFCLSRPSPIHVHESQESFSVETGLSDSVLTKRRNNDKTVKLYSLSENRLLSTLDFPFPMNHASIRPDGEALVAVGDAAFGETINYRSPVDAREGH